MTKKSSLASHAQQPLWSHCAPCPPFGIPLWGCLADFSPDVARTNVCPQGGNGSASGLVLQQKTGQMILDLGIANGTEFS